MKRLVREAELRALGEDLGRTLPPHSVVWLMGDLGVGKTGLARAMVRGRRAETAATSPTFSLVHHYEAPAGPVYHVDCYRFRSPAEADALDWAALAEADLLLVEWPERGGAWVPAPTTTVVLEHVDQPDQRRLELVRSDQAPEEPV